MIPETTNLPLIPKIVTETPVSTTIPSPQVTPFISNLSIVVDSYLDTKVRDVIQNELQKHTADLIYKYYLRHLVELTKKPTPIAEQESEKSSSKILKIKKEQAEIQKNPHFTIKSTDKAALEEYDLKSALYQSMHANKSFYRNPANHRLYHALMKALIKDENAMDKGVADTVKDHKRKHDDDEGPLAGPNQGKKTKRRRTKESESSKKPSSTKETPKDWFKQPPRPSTPDPEWNKRQVVLDQPKQPWFNQMVFATKDLLTFNDLMATPIDFSKQRRLGMRSKELKTWSLHFGVPLNMRMTKMLKRESSTRVKDVNCGTDLRFISLKKVTLLSTPETNMPKKCLPSLRDSNTSYSTVNGSLEYLCKRIDQKKLNITKPQKTFLEIKFKEPYTPSYDPPRIVYEDLNKQKRVLRADDLYKFSDGTLKYVRDEIHHRVLDFLLDYNTEMPTRKWTAVTEEGRSYD
ncbi:hypothetical protein Tco_1212415 [Tanacetum coccineum]